MKEKNETTGITRTFTVGVYALNYGDIEVEARSKEEAEEIVRNLNAYEQEIIADPELGFLITTYVCASCPDNHPYGPLPKCQDPDCVTNNLHRRKK